MSKTTTVGEQFDIFIHYVHELEMLDKTLIQCFKEDPNGSEPALTTAKAKYNTTRRKSLEPLDFMLEHKEHLDPATICAVE